MRKLDEIRNELSQADEILLDLRLDMENNIRDYMIVEQLQPLEVDVTFCGDNHHMVVTIETLSEDGDGDENLLFEDKRTGVTGMKIYDADLSTDLLAGICMMLSDRIVMGNGSRVGIGRHN
jgi:hypothetical protein